MQESDSRSNMLETTEWVEEHLGHPSIVVVEVNSDLGTDYNQGHVPGAVGWGLHTDMEHPIRRDVPDVAQLEQLLGWSGIDNDTTILLYGDGNNRSATWAFWVLEYYRHRDIRLMDGGRKKWIDEGRPLSTEVPDRASKTYKAPAPDSSVRVMKEYVVENLWRSGFKLLDTRTYEEYTGLLTSAPGTPQVDIYRKGRIPGAIHIPWDDGVDDDGAFKSVEELSERYLGQGIDPSQEVVPYCRLGVRASYSWFILKHLLDYPMVRNYDGSWTEWGNSAGVPIETDEASP